MVLPVDSVLGDILDALRRHRNVVVEAPPGAGKTTRVPPALLAFGPVIVLEPRRLAARLAARRVAAEMGERVGETVGYQVRFEDVSSARTRLRFATEGVLTRRLISDRELQGVATVVLDEFHERHLEGDVALALLRRLQLTHRPDLRLVIMSATLDGARLAEWLEACPVIRAEGRLFPLEITFTPHSAAPLEEQVAVACASLLARGHRGDILVFLPGAAEIRRALRACQPLADRSGWLALPLYGDLPPEEQDRAVLPSDQPRIIFSTNVAESSLTIEGVTAVVDSGLARIPRDDPYTGLPSLDITRIAQANAIQRAGRAGRTAPGRVIRLYPEADFVRRPPAETPEIRRRELSHLMVDLDAMGLAAEEVPWFEAPPAAALDAARALLNRLGAHERARSLARLPLHPRLGTLVAVCPTEEACRLAAALSVNDRAPDIDVLSLLDAEPSYQARRLGQLLRRLVRPRRAASDDELRQALLCAFPDRVVRAHTVTVPQARTHLVATGLLLAIEIEERREHALPLVRLASPVEPLWLLDAFPNRVRESVTLEWNRQAERVEAVSALLYDDVLIEESRSGAADPALAARLLAGKAREAGLDRFTDPDALEALLARCRFAARHSGLAPPDLDRAVELACQGLRSFTELARVDFPALLLAQYSPAERQLLDKLAPERLRLPSGRTARVHYSADQDPWVASRLQDFFGCTDTPRLANGEVPVVLHLLAPNQRPVQTTTDLAGFWQRLYPQVRRELARRYPRHAWPEDPLRPAG